MRIGAAPEDLGWIATLIEHVPKLLHLAGLTWHPEDTFVA